MGEKSRICAGSRPRGGEHIGMPPVDWRRFEDIAPSDTQRRDLQTLLEEKGLSRHDLALILLSLRVRPEFSLEDFDT